MSVMYDTPAHALNVLAMQLHHASSQAGWWPPKEERTPELFACKVALIHSEASEMLEGLRKGIPDDHLPDRSMEEVEAADLLIRIFDYAGARGLDLTGALLEKAAYNAQRADHKPEARAASHGKKF